MKEKHIGKRRLTLNLLFRQPFLLEELMMALDMLEQETLSPGLLSTKRQIMKNMEKILPKVYENP